MEILCELVAVSAKGGGRKRAVMLTYHPDVAVGILFQKFAHELVKYWKDWEMGGGGTWLLIGSVLSKFPLIQVSSLLCTRHI